jgi:hypothetical protein
MLPLRSCGLGAVFAAFIAAGAGAQVAPTPIGASNLTPGARIQGPTLCGKHAKNFEKEWANGIPCADCQATGAGHAMVGGSNILSGEPTPIGVVRTNYNSAAPIMPGAPSADLPGHAIVSSPTLVPPKHHDPRPHLIHHLLGIPKIGGKPRNNWWTDRHEMQQAVMALPPGDPNARLTELPASWVYGKNRRHW